MLLGVDVGGTFTDAALLDGTTVHTAKVPTTPKDPARGVLEAIRALLARAGVKPGEVTRFAHGMTVATNALLEGRSARTVLVATEGFTDVVELGRQARPELYRLCAAAPRPLVPRELRFGAPERMAPEGALLELSPASAEELVAELSRLAPEAVAVALLHSYADPSHERLLGEVIAARLPHVHLTLSHELVGTFREYERTATTEVDAALSPLLAGYLRVLASEAAAQGLPLPEVMQSSGGLMGAREAGAHAARTVLSGPAGGVRGALHLAELAGERNVLCFDMGGTSCDVCLIRDGTVAETAERLIGGRPLTMPALDIHTVGAGGGSIAWRDPGGALRVGPQSAGAVPGPACYARGGESPTVTDANVVLGRLPADLPLAGGLALDREAARRVVSRLADELGLELVDCAEGIVRVAEAEMVRALRVMTVERGIDPRDFALMSFGGGGPLHAVAMAGELGMERVLCPRSSGVLCAVGLAQAPPRRDVSRSVMLSGGEFTGERVAQERDALLERARTELAGDPESHRVLYELRYQGQSFELAVEENRSVDPERLASAFAEAHEERYGYREPGLAVELVTIRVSVWCETPPAKRGAPHAERAAPRATTRKRRRAFFSGRELDVEGLRGELPAGASLHGPAICSLPESTLLVPPGWIGRVDRQGTVHLQAAQAQDPDAPHGRSRGGASVTRRDSGRVAASDPIELQVLAGALRAACEEMGAALIRAAHSANIKERRDASTALFDAAGDMVMQAEHIPVHLGAMPDAVAAVLGEEHREGRSWILNDPFAGGTHLPDITVITPVFCAGALVGFAASRAHHADVGGRSPGSMPADSRSLEEEGVVIPPQIVSEASIDRLAGLMRQPSERRADLRAQLAANRIGALRMAELAERFGRERLQEATGAVMDYAERRTRACLEALWAEDSSARSAEDVLEARAEDLPLRLRATIADGRLTLDFSGSAPQHEGNLNCPLAVTRSACYFAVRVLTDPDIPPSAGAYRPIDVRAPLGTILNARPGAAVAAGNVETSSRVADLVLGAFGRALGQGTMNNLTLGNDGFTYYETLGGGQGACEDADGPSGVHVAMSNTLNTPIEALERELPLRVSRYELRRGSGGEGRHRGGDGVVRELEALEPMSYSLIAERRRHAPPGAAGGAPGAPGRDLLIAAPASSAEAESQEATRAPVPSRELPGKVSGTLAAGERLRIETPGGGGFGGSDNKR
jgi:N-methylhydantoinase A/oxoprolinase/acetone carboxylase beta subunit/N-methylhydantoinase B/oxoprolinase/acetone carboxylase alpha subunit